jgi:hypothetical protein
MKVKEMFDFKVPRDKDAGKFLIQDVPKGPNKYNVSNGIKNIQEKFDKVNF